MKNLFEKQGPKITCALAMVLFGTIGIFVRYISLPSSLIAMIRGLVGVLFLGAVLLIKRQKINWKSMKENFLLLFVSGAFIGFNWILLFESYRYTTIAVATLCYYMAPVFVVLLSPLVQKEKLTGKKMLCLLAAVGGMVCISGVLDQNSISFSLKGIGFGLGAALLYASVILLNKKIKGISVYERTLSQLGVAGLVLLPYNLLTVEWSSISLDTRGLCFLLFVGVVHTGLAYTLYFGAMEKLPVQLTAMLSYIDPVTAVFLSIVLLKEPFGISSLIGMVLILGAAIFSEKN